MCAAGSPAWAELDSAGTTAASTGSLQEVWNKKMEETPQPGKEMELSEPDITEEETEKLYNTTPQLSEWDILRMNNGDADFLYSDEGYLTFLRGKFYEDKVTDPEEGITALFGIAKLLGLSKGAEFFGVFAEQNRFGYTYITYKQRYGDLTLENAVLKLVIDPEGYTAGLVCSFTPNVGMAGPEESSVTSREAEQIVLDYYPQYQMTVYPDHTRQTSVTVNDVAYHAWAVFTDYPAEASPPEGRGYLEHLVAYDGSYLMYMAVSSPEELVLGDNAQTELALAWFEGMEADTWTGTVTLHDGTKKKITVPVVCDPKTGTYYLADLQRHILLADYYEYSFEKKYVPWSSQDNTGWPQHYLLTYETYIKVYDFFAEYGLVSVDGFGMPILILTDYCDRAHTPENNACYMGMMNGWAVFAASEHNVKHLLRQMSVQTIGYDKINQLRHVRYLKSVDGVKAHMKKQADYLRPKFDFTLAALESGLRCFGIGDWTNPNGGYFISYDGLPGTAARCVQLCADAGVKLTPAGAAFPYGIDPEDKNIRIAPTFLSFGDLNMSMEVFCLCQRIAALEALLAEKA